MTVRALKPVLAALIVQALLPPASALAQDRPLKLLNQLSANGLVREERDAFIAARIEVSNTGDMAEVSIMTSYPQGVYDDRVISAIKKANRYRPEMRGGIAVAAEAMEVVTKTTRGSSRELRTPNKPAFTAALDDIAKDDGAAARQALAVVKTNYDSAKLNLGELAVYYACLAPLERAQRNYQKAKDYAESAYALLGGGREQDAFIDQMNFEVILDDVALGNVSQAQRRYDNVQRRTKKPLPTALTDLVRRAGTASPGTMWTFDQPNIGHALQQQAP